MPILHTTKHSSMQISEKTNGGSHFWNPPLFTGCFFTAPFAVCQRTPVLKQRELAFFDRLRSPADFENQQGIFCSVKIYSNGIGPSAGLFAYICVLSTVTEYIKGRTNQNYLPVRRFSGPVCTWDIPLEYWSHIRQYQQDGTHCIPESHPPDPRC